MTPWNEDSGVIDRLLARSGLRREVAVQLPTVLAALFLAGSTDFLLTAPDMPHRHWRKPPASPCIPRRSTFRPTCCGSTATSSMSGVMPMRG